MKRFGIMRWVLIYGLILAYDIARAVVPVGPPTFSNPLNFTNLFQPFQPGGVKVYTGRTRGSKSVVLDIYLTETRQFVVNGTTVETHILREQEFEDGKLEEISQNYFAQADNGAVYYFGEVVDIYENGVVVSHEGSWLVGGPTLPTDPPETATAISPTLFMPANPEVGDVFRQEDLLPVVDETDRVIRTGVKVRVPAGRFRGAIVIRETSELDPIPETKWYAPGVGVVLSRAKRETLMLQASTLVQQKTAAPLDEQRSPSQ